VPVYSANQMNKLSLVGMQLPKKYKENFDVSSEGPSSGISSGTDEGPSSGVSSGTDEGPSSGVSS
jgi:hypothetical protein